MKINRRVFVCGLAGLASSVLLDERDFVDAQGRQGVVNLYSARHYDTDSKMYKSFTEKTGIKVNLLEASADKLIERIKSEGRNSPADVIITVDAANLYRAKQAGLFQPISSSILNSRVPNALRDSQRYWFGISKRARVIIYHRDRVNPSALSTYEDLANRKWRGKILVRTSSHVYNQSLMASIVAANGTKKAFEWARGFVGNLARPPEGGDIAQIQAVSSGVGDLAIANTYYFARLAKSSKKEDRDVVEKLGIFFPNQSGRGTHVNISGAGVARNAPNRSAAIAFLEHLTDPESQVVLAKGNNEYPVVRGTNLDPVLSSFGTFKEDELNATEYAKFLNEAIRIMDRAGWR